MKTTLRDDLLFAGLLAVAVVAFVCLAVALTWVETPYRYIGNGCAPYTSEGT